jgi:hypothetical protein
MAACDHLPDGAMTFAITRIRRGLTVAVVAAAAATLVGGCGGGASGATSKAKAGVQVPTSPVPGLTPPQGGNSGFVPAPSPTGRAADPAAVAVIRGWSDALLRGDVHAAGGYFALPSEMINGSDSNGDALVLTLRSRAQADVASSTLPCGAKLLSTDQRGRYVNALFRLTGRPGPGGSSCGSGAGLTARTNFVIAHGKIVDWIRAPDDPGDNSSPGQQTTPQAPPQPQSGPQGQPAV